MGSLAYRFIVCALTSTGCTRSGEDPARDAAQDAATSSADATTPPELCTAPSASWVSGPEDTHCSTDSERPLQQRIGPCSAATAVDNAIPSAGVLLNGRGADDDCKYQLELTHDACRTVLSVRAATGLVDQAGARAELRDDAGALLYEAPAEPLGAGRYAWKLEAMPGAATLHVFLFELCSYTDEASPRAHAAFKVSL